MDFIASSLSYLIYSLFCSVADLAVLTRALRPIQMERNSILAITADAKLGVRTSILVKPKPHKAYNEEMLQSARDRYASAIYVQPPDKQGAWFYTGT